MSILDDAIREHLELKRANGADEGDLKRLEDEAFGPTQRPDQADPFTEAPTEFLVSPTDAPAAGDEAAPSRRPDIADLQEAPPADAPVPAPPGDAPVPAEAQAPAAPPAPTPADELSPAPDAPPPSPADAAPVPLPPPVDEIPSGPTTEERHAIADQPTQMFDVQAHLTDAEPAAPSTEQPSPTDEQLVDAAQSEPQVAPPAPAAEEAATPTADVDPPTEPTPPTDVAPPTEVPEQAPLASRGPDAEVAGHPPTDAVAPEEESAEYDFLNEQRLADELDQALEAPITTEGALPTYEDATAPGGVFDFEQQGKAYEEDPSEEVLRRMDEPPSEEAAREHAAPSPGAEPPSEELEPASEELEPISEEIEPVSDEFEPPSDETPRAAAEPPSEESDIDYDPSTGHEDVLEETPRFLEDAPEDDDLWFEQKPPKDFDLD